MHATRTRKTAPAHGTRDRPAPARLAWIVLGATLLLVAHAGWMRAALLGNGMDDAYISFRYADHLAHDQGLVFNAGERVEGYSNLLWILILTPFAALGIDLVPVSQILGLACSILALFLAVWGLRRVLHIESDAAAVSVALLLASSGYFASWSVAGLETGLHALLLLAAWLRWLIEFRAGEPKRPFSALLFGALALTRPEGAAVALAAVLGHLILSRMHGRPLRSRQTLAFPLLLGAIVLAHQIWRWSYYGPHLLPNSVQAKVDGSSRQMIRGAEYVAKYFLNPYAPLLIPVLFYRRGSAQVDLLTGNLLWIGCLVMVALSGGDWSYGRFFAPLLPLAAVVSTAALHERITRAGSRRPRRWPWPLLAASWVLIVVVSLFTTVRREMIVRRIVAYLGAERIEMGKLLRSSAPPNTVIAVTAAGQIPYYSGLRTHDMLGLNDPYIARLRPHPAGYRNPGHEKWDVDYTLRVVQPDIIIEGTRIPDMVRHPLYKERYAPVSSWNYLDVGIRRELLAAGSQGAPLAIPSARDSTSGRDSLPSHASP